MNEQYRSRVFTDRPSYADFGSPRKFDAIMSIIAKRLTEHPNAICSYSGGSDSDIMIDLIERTREVFNLPPVKYAFFNTGLEMRVTRDHVKRTAKKYGVEIQEYRPKINIVRTSRIYGIPFVSKIMSAGLSGWQKKGIPLSIADEYNQAEDKFAKRQELKERYPGCESVINFLCCCNTSGEPRPNIQLVINSSKYMRDFIRDCPTMCFTETAEGQFRLRPLYYVSDADKAWYKDYYDIRYSDAYEVYGLTRTGCCGCPISYKAVEDLEKIRPYEPNVVKAAWNIFGASYEYRAKYNEYKRGRMEKERQTL